MPGSVYKRGDIYWIKFYDKGKAYRTSAKTENITDAKKLLSKYLGEVATGTFKGLRDDMVSMQELFDDFEEDSRRRKRRGMNRIVSHMQPLRAWFGAMQVEQVHERDIDRYISIGPVPHVDSSLRMRRSVSQHGWRVSPKRAETCNALEGAPWARLHLDEPSETGSTLVRHLLSASHRSETPERLGTPVRFSSQ